ncbi:glycosyltransferase [Pedococcus ginsenosidimutans]|uniref:Glycosyltransferase n=1 Tax=Pedococcus ginsenosidimutans TaxID=490570 RepID=A0ABP8XJZ9_9MICO
MSVSYGVLSTYPPTPCGLATFSRSLVDALGSPEDVVGVVQLVDGPEEVTHPEVVHQWVRGSAEGAAGAAAVLDRHDVVVVQHEYGIFGGPDGADVLEVARRLSAPVVLVVHTVLVSPSARQLHIVRELAARSAAVVTMTRTARDRLVAHYGLDVEAVTVVPHGAAPGTAVASTHRVRPAQQRPVVLTWGLLGAGKGIEWGVEALDQLRDLSPRYRVVGRTHPKVLEHEGERYRDALVERARRTGVEDLLEFDARYLPPDDLRREVDAADVVLLPYDSTEQVTSGVLVEALAAGKPVVSTRFPHAVEVLGSGAGLLVGRQAPGAIAQGLRRVLTEPGLAEAMSAEARRIAPQLLWPAVAQQYRDLAGQVLSARVLAGV